MYSFPNLEPVCCSMSSSNCCFLACVQISQKAGKVVWYSHLFKNFPQFVVIHTVKGFSRVSEAVVDVLLEFSCFLEDGLQQDFYQFKVLEKWLNSHILFIFMQRAFLNVMFFIVIISCYFKNNFCFLLGAKERKNESCYKPQIKIIIFV